MTEDNRFDGILMSIIQQKGNIDGFFDSVFGFLRRNTDFFANQKKAEEIIVNTCKKNYDKFTADQAEKKKQEAKKKQAEEKKRKQKQQQAQKEAAKKQTPAVKPPASEPVKQPEPTSTQQKKQKEEDNTPVPIGNGGRTEKYIWTQTLENVEMYIYADKEVNKKNVKIDIGLDSLKVVVKGETIVSGKLKQKINPDDSLWTIEEGEVQDYKGKYIYINIEKWKNQTSWWSCVVQGDKQINTQKINPEPSKLSDLDGETRSTVEKMMFDMRQKQAGLPSSDQLQKQEKLKQFMKAHPEMDFSQCKFN